MPRNKRKNKTFYFTLKSLVIFHALLVRILVMTSGGVSAENNVAVSNTATTEALTEPHVDVRDDDDGKTIDMHSTMTTRSEVHPRIYNGTEVDPPGKYPFVVNIFEYEYITYGNKINKCGGSLIYPNVVLTAAHCVDPAVSGIRVRIGRHHLHEEEEEEADAEEFGILTVVIHPDYINSSIPPRYDMALLVLDGTSKYGTIALDDGISYPLSSGGAVNIVGWGKMESGIHSPVLLHTEIEYLPNDQCRNYCGNYIYDDSLCLFTADSGKGACNGDSGGPAFKNNPEDQMPFVQIGVASWGLADCEQSPSVYTRVSAGYEW
eukprot:CAMPEP_0116010180 /NCGR_PEP_ID=MMETSP0321-20121206/3856_1 /TAXON_ID=163516 /ORGANISM="Leptocylindrus danicus var. danicus, Strain B650" /LENGTH=319 /DNA_ID=CAMNT_0003479247 /DNA_START=186 /DNA_END=1142 /DNA_ORIENTATION=-